MHWALMHLKVCTSQTRQFFRHAGGAVQLMLLLRTQQVPYGWTAAPARLNPLTTSTRPTPRPARDRGRGPLQKRLLSAIEFTKTAKADHFMTYGVKKRYNMLLVHDSPKPIAEQA
jgi:hypothetical protein